MHVCELCPRAEEGAAQLAAANVQPIKPVAPVPEQGCVPLHLLRPGRVVASCPGEYMEGADVALEDFRLLLSDVAGSSYTASPILLAALQV